jgi:AhpD family alkylhydroperoxidase
MAAAPDGPVVHCRFSGSGWITVGRPGATRDVGTARRCGKLVDGHLASASNLPFVVVHGSTLCRDTTPTRVAYVVFLLFLLTVGAATAYPDWCTPAEKSGNTTPNYEETLNYLRRVQKTEPDKIHLERYGTTTQNRSMMLVVASGKGPLTPEAARPALFPWCSSKPASTPARSRTRTQGLRCRAISACDGAPSTIRVSTPSRRSTTHRELQLRKDQRADPLIASRPSHYLARLNAGRCFDVLHAAACRRIVIENGNLPPTNRRRPAMHMIDWNTYRQQLVAGVGGFGKLSPDTVKGYVQLGQANAKTGVFDAKTRELIALAVAISLRCDGCIAVHTAAAKKAGATKEEIAEALGVAISVNAGAALVYSTRTMDAFDAATEA